MELEKAINLGRCGLFWPTPPGFRTTTILKYLLVNAGKHVFFMEKARSYRYSRGTEGI